ncbi:MAG: hypothetical protein M3298_01055, partial [Thermoproteota archaeon]|nr:hypothetical protein [Thermoproteota archaeon]
QKEMDRVGFELTTSALYHLCKGQMMKENLSAQIPSSRPFLFACTLLCMHTINRSFEEELAEVVKNKTKVPDGFGSVLGLTECCCYY